MTSKNNTPVIESSINGGQSNEVLNPGIISPVENNAEPATPLLPIDGFPTAIQEFIQHCARTYNTPRDYWAGAVLASTALAIGDKIQLESRFIDVPIIWICNVGDVSTGKTEPFKKCFKFFEDKDDESIRIYRRDMEAYERAQDDPDSDNTTRPRCFQYILKDATPEAMALVHAVNKRGIMYYRDELKGFIDDFGRYNKSGEQSSMLSTFSRVSMTINRVSSGPVNIANPCILIAGGMQPDLLPSLAKEARAESGFMARFAFIYPDNSIKPYYSREVLPEGLIDSYYDYLDHLISLPDPLTIHLSREAEEEYARWFNYNVDQINQATIGYLKGVFGKLDIYCLRMVTIIRGMRLVHEGDVSEEVTLDELKAAINITEYFRATALKVYERIFKTSYQPVSKRDVAIYLHHNSELPKAQIAILLKTSRSRLNEFLK